MNSKIVIWGLAIATAIIVAIFRFQPNVVEQPVEAREISAQIVPSIIPAALPTPQPHPLPLTLAQWQDPSNSGDYFSQVVPVEVGYLVWSQFPIRVYVEPSIVANSNHQAQQWKTAVSQAIQEWQAYLPLVAIEQSEQADIMMLRSAPPLRYSPRSKIPRARSAETRYELYVRPTTPEILSHRCKIWLSPRQTGKYMQAAARHELGHALGIWGHSLVASDALYFSQVRNPSLISARDVNTLKRIYEQPTRLGWSLESVKREKCL